MKKTFIINQPSLKNIPYGCKNSDYNGCGWISAFNLMNFSGIETDSPEAFASRDDVQRCVLCRGLLGTNPFKLAKFLRYHGIEAHLTINTYKSAERRVVNSESGIIMYFHHRGAHFVMYSTSDDNKCHFYNAVYGRTDHIEDIGGFINKHCHFGLIILITGKN